MRNSVSTFYIAIVISTLWIQFTTSTEALERYPDEYFCRPSILSFSSNFTRVDNPVAVNNYYLSTNGESTRYVLVVDGVLCSDVRRYDA